MPDGAALIRPTGGETGFVGRIRCLHRHPAEVLQRALRLVFEDVGAYFLLLSEGNVSADISNFVTTNTKRCAIRFSREQSNAIDRHHKITC